MSILSSTPTPTPQQLVYQAAVVPILSNFSQLSAVYNNGMADVWGNGLGLTPQQFFDACGTGAVAVVEIAYETMTYLNSLATKIPGAVPVLGPPAALTLNADGTVTVGATNADGSGWKVT